MPPQLMLISHPTIYLAGALPDQKDRFAFADELKAQDWLSDTEDCSPEMLGWKRYDDVPLLGSAAKKPCVPFVWYAQGRDFAIIDASKERFQQVFPDIEWIQVEIRDYQVTETFQLGHHVRKIPS